MLALHCGAVCVLCVKLPPPHFIRLLPAGAGGLPDVEDGTGSPSVRLCTAARLQFSYITEAVQNLLRDLPGGIQNRQNSINSLVA
jgi:hypothetical protein